MVGGKPAEHSDTSGVDRGSSEDDGRPQVPRQLWPTVHLRISASPITGTDPGQSSSWLLYAASARCSVSSRVLQSRQQFGYHHSGAPPGLNTATTGRSPHSPPDPEIEAAVINMECHEQASRDNNNNPQ